MTILASVNNKTVMPGITPIADVPDRPTIGTATAGEGSASVTFTASTTGGTPTTFTATSNPGSITGTASSSPITLSGLSGGTSYTFTVTAGNSTGTSPASSASNSVTPTTIISGGYDSLATVRLSASTTSINFSGIPSGYKHLQIRAIARTDRTVDARDYFGVRFNSDTSSSYTGHALIGSGAAASSGGGGAGTEFQLGLAASAAQAASIFGTTIIDILDSSSTTKYKTVRWLSGIDSNDAYGSIRLESGAWLNTSAITSISIEPGIGTNFVANTKFALYGVK